MAAPMTIVPECVSELHPSRSATPALWRHPEGQGAARNSPSSINQPNLGSLSSDLDVCAFDSSKRKTNVTKHQFSKMIARNRARVGATFIVGAFFAATSTPAAAIECVQFVKDDLQKTYPNLDFSALRGNATDWYKNAKNAHGSRVVGSVPSKGAVMVFAGSGERSRFPSYASFAAGAYGHVALVKTVVDGQNITVDHANWRPNRIDRNVKVMTRDGWVTASVYNLDSGTMGGNRYAVAGFISPALFPLKKK